MAMMLQSLAKSKIISIVNHQLRIGQVTELLVFSIIAYSFWNIINKELLVGWYVFSVVSVVARFGLTFYTDKRAILVEQSIQKLTAILCASAFFAGLSWGFVGTLLMPAGIFAKQMFAFFLLIGAVAGANIFYSGVKNVYFYFLVPSYIPHIVWLFMQGSSFVELGVCAIIYLSMMIGLSIFINRFVINSVQLQFENKDLIESLSNAKKQLEYLNIKLNEEASHDQLTNLLNRKSMNEILNELLDITQRRNGILAILFCDIDNFKQVNDNFGHDVGDELLVQTAKRLKSSLTDSDVVARLGGDEFIVILNNIKDEAHIKTVLNKVMDTIHQPIVIQGQTFHVGMSIGISLFPYDARDNISLLKYADCALYRAKSAGRNRYILYSDLEVH
jgi:diguanylate cyclase (GGDEF)-like protein